MVKMPLCVQERQRKLIGGGTIGKMVTVLERDRKYAEVSLITLYEIIFIHWSDKTSSK